MVLQPLKDHLCQSSYPAEVRKWNFSPFFSAKGVVKFGVKFWWNFPSYVFQGLGVRRKISPKFHVKNGVKNGKFHANFTLQGRSADLWKTLLASVRTFQAGSRFVYFLSSLRGQMAKTLICAKSGVSAEFQKECRKVRRTALFAQNLYTFCAKSAVLRAFLHFSALFLESAETPLFVQINVFAVWPLRLDRKYTIADMKTL